MSPGDTKAGGPPTTMRSLLDSGKHRALWDAYGSTDGQS